MNKYRGERHHFLLRTFSKTDYKNKLSEGSKTVKNQDRKEKEKVKERLKKKKKLSLLSGKMLTLKPKKQIFQGTFQNKNTE